MVLTVLSGTCLGLECGPGSVVVVLGSHLLDSGGVVRGSSGC